MKRIHLVAAVLAVLLLAAGAALLLWRARQPWTSDSQAALDAFQRCREAMMKLYYADARQSCQQAVDADPSFAMARLMLAMTQEDREKRDQLFEELRKVDLVSLSPRERFMLSYHLARHDHQAEEAGRILDAYLADHPDDPFALSNRCDESWSRQDFAAAELCYRRLLEVDPNWVQAQNHLGYLAMAQGRFREAEELFDTYGFIAPDQANPHDSLGELLTLTGRYEEAATQLERAIAVRADFCAAYEHLIRVRQLEDRYPEAEAVLARMSAQPGCSGDQVERLRCSIRLWREMHRRDWEAAWRVAAEECPDQPGDVAIFADAAALATGRRDEARRLEQRIADSLSQKTDERPKAALERDVQEAVLRHLEGARLLADGSLAEAAASLRTADEKLRYWHDSGLGIFKLYNRVTLARALERMGQRQDAAELMAEVRAVNPSLAADMATTPAER